MNSLPTILRRLSAAAMLTLVAMLWGGPIQAQTADTTCIKPLPWGTSFEPDEHGGVPLQCWTTIHQYGIYPTNFFDYPSDGAYSLAMTGTVGFPCMIASPRLAHRADSLHVSFQLTMTSGNGTLQVGLMNGTVFVPLLTVSIADARLGLYEFYTDDFPSTDSLSVAFSLDNGRVCIDEVLVEAATLCRRPCQAQVDEVGIYGAVVSWSDCGGSPMSYIVHQIDTAAHDTVTMVADDTEIAFFGMSPGTTYFIEVASACSDDTTGWFPVGLITTDVTCRQPTGATVAALTASAVGISWEYDNDGINVPTGMQVTMSSQAGLPVSHFTTGDFLLVDGLATGHTYQATLRTVCSSDTSTPITLTFTPLADACAELEGTTTSQQFPIAVASPYSYSQMLYPASMLDGMDSLYALAFRVEGTPIMYGPRTVEVYIGQTVDSTLTENISTMSAQHVVTAGTFAPAEAGWARLLFDHPIAVNNQRNLLITITDNTGTMGGMLRFGTRYGSFGGTLYGVSTVMPLDPGMPLGSLTASSAVAELQLFGNCPAPSCMPPAAMVTAPAPTSLTLGWAGYDGSCAVRYRAHGSSNWLVSAPHTGNCTLTGLNPATLYELCVGAICSSDTVYGDVFQSNTGCGIVSVPYIADFSQGTNTCWQGQQNTSYGGVRLTGMLVSPQFAQDISTLQAILTLTGSGMISVGVCDADGANLQWVDTVVIDDEWVYTVYFDGYNGQSRCICFASSSTTAVLHSVIVEPLPDCMPPRDLEVTAVGGSSATIAWNGSTALYEVHLTEMGSNRWTQWQTSATQLTLDGLAGSTSFEGYVITRCGQNSSSEVWFSFTTGCETITYFPHSESFESPLAPAQCWQLAYADPANATANPMLHTTEHSCDGHRSFRFSSYNYVPSDVYNQYLISPRIVSDDSIWFQFRFRKDNIEAEPFSVGFSTSGNAVSDFLWLGTEQFNTVGQWLEYSIGLPAATRYVAIHYMGQNSYYLYIDDLTITGPGCEAPTITTIDEQTDAVSIGWTSGGATSYVAITDGLWLNNIEGIAVNGNEYTFSALEQGRRYTVGVRTLCPDGHLSDWTTQQVVTISTSCAAPTALAVGDVGYTSAELSWQPMGDAGLWQLCLLSSGTLLALSQPIDIPAAHIAGLEQGMDYSIMVRSICGDIPGPWSDPLNFSTPECYTVSDVTYERIDFRTVSLSWQEAPVSTGMHRVEYGRQGFQRGTGTVIESMDMPLTISNMEPEPDYDIYIQNYCRPDVLSDSAVMITVPSGLGISEPQTPSLELSINPNPAIGDVTVAAGGGEEFTLTVVDVQGRTVLSMVGMGAVSIPRTALSSGTYFVRVVSSGGTAVGKLIKR